MISLTNACKVFYEYSVKIISLIEETKAVISEFGSGDKGKIIIGAPNTVQTNINGQNFLVFNNNAILCQ
jgi:DNA-binding transcriptional LysR family regulator